MLNLREKKVIHLTIITRLEKHVSNDIEHHTEKEKIQSDTSMNHEDFFLYGILIVC